MASAMTVSSARFVTARIDAGRELPAARRDVVESVAATMLVVLDMAPPRTSVHVLGG